MAKFEAEGVIIRKLDKVEIIFYSTRSIYVYGVNNITGVIFHRWYAPLGSYGDGWKIFRQKLMQYKRLDLNKCFELAHVHQIDTAGSGGRLDLKGKKVIYRK